MDMEALEKLATANSARIIAFDRAEVVPGIIPDTYFLVVHGQAPCLNMSVALSPLIYIRCPEYWGIEVIGTLPGGFCLDTVKPYCVTIPLSGVTGSCGIEVIGANRRETFEVAGGCRP